MRHPAGERYGGGMPVEEQTEPGAPRRASRAQIGSVALGNALEFYDFLIFSIFAVQIGQAFFPATDPVNSLLAALATFGAGFVTRPLGAWVFGRYADRRGRRPAMVASFTVLGLSSLALALVPSYATIGAAAPIMAIVARLVQGLALGGEVGPSSAFLAEIAPPERRGLYVSLQFASQNAAVLVAGLVGVGLAAVMSATELSTWGWRIALVFGAAIVPVGLILRRSLPETMELPVAGVPARAVPRYRHIAVAALATIASATVINYVLTYLSTFAQSDLGLSPGKAFGATVAVGVGGTIGAIAGGKLSDHFGRRPVMLIPIVLTVIMIMPAFLLLRAYPVALALYAVALIASVRLGAGGHVGVRGGVGGVPDCRPLDRAGPDILAVGIDFRRNDPVCGRRADQGHGQRPGARVVHAGLRDRRPGGDGHAARNRAEIHRERLSTT